MPKRSQKPQKSQIFIDMTTGKMIVEGNLSPESQKITASLSEKLRQEDFNFDDDDDAPSSFLESITLEKQSELTPQDKQNDFFKMIFKLGVPSGLPYGTVKAINDAYEEKMGLKPGESRTTDTDATFCLGDYVLKHTFSTRLLLAFMSEAEQHNELLLKRTEHLIETLKIVYYTLHPFSGNETANNNTEKFFLALEECLFSSTLLSFSAEATKKNYEEITLLDNYITKTHLRLFKQSLKISLRVFEQNLDGINCSETQKENILKPYKTYNENLIKTYQKNTRPALTTPRVFLDMTAMGFLFIGSSLVLGFGATSFMVATILTFGLDYVGKNELGIRDLSPQTAKKFETQHSTASLAAQAQQAQVSIPSHMQHFMSSKLTSQERKLFKHYLTLTKKQQWQATGLKTATDKDFKLPIKRIDTNNTSATATTYDYSTVTNIYRLAKNKKKRPTKTTEATDTSSSKSEVSSPTTSTYQQLKFSLSPALKTEGILVVKETSKAFFKYGDQQAAMTKALANKTEQGVFTGGFASIRGDFGGFKYLNNLSRYELKLFDGTRIEFEKSEKQIAVQDSSGSTHQVPCWEPIKAYEK